MKYGASISQANVDKVLVALSDLDSVPPSERSRPLLKYENGTIRSLTARVLWSPPIASILVHTNRIVLSTTPSSFWPSFPSLHRVSVVPVSILHPGKQNVYYLRQPDDAADSGPEAMKALDDTLDKAKHDAEAATLQVKALEGKLKARTAAATNDQLLEQRQVFDHFSGISQHHTTPHTPCEVRYLVPMPIGC